ncbi:MAG: hypothetical protein PHC45_00205 [Clostridiaceae bacterium]|nr:hypothetical protein [Clostridiaceae bacterium]
MNILDFRKIDESNHKKVTFIRVEPINLQSTLTDIINTLSDLSWISRFDEEYIREGFRARALPTVCDITAKLIASSSEQVSEDAGEYVVSELSRSAIVNQLNYLSVPLAELYSKQVSKNPGFDFHTQNDCETLIFGEAKYSSSRNAYGTGLKQVVEFISDGKDKKDIPDLRDFFCEAALRKVMKGTKGFAIGFSAKATASDSLIRNITQNQDYKILLGYEEIILVAVNI